MRVQKGRNRMAMYWQAVRQRETDGGREEADTNSLGEQHWHSQQGTAGSIKS